MLLFSVDKSVEGQSWALKSPTEKDLGLVIGEHELNLEQFQMKLLNLLEISPFLAPVC